MGMEAKLVQKMGQALTLTPQLQQAIRLLTLGRLEYGEAIARELLENPILEEMPDEYHGGAPEEALRVAGPESLLAQPEAVGVTDESFSEPRADWETYRDSFSDYSGSASPKNSTDFEDRQPPEVVSVVTESLEQHLLEQLRFQDCTERECGIAQHLIGDLDDAGYLVSSYEDIAAHSDVEVQEVAKVAEMLRFFDPVGVCSRTLQECLLTQLEAQGRAEGLEGRLVSQHLEKLEKRRFDAIARAEGVSIDEVARAVATLRTLEPKPGRPFVSDSTRYIVPDAYVHKVGTEYLVTLNDDGQPRLRLNPLYTTMIKETDSLETISKSYLSERVRAATWLLKSIQQRQQTILKVTESIMKFQREFLDHGISKLKPLVLKDVADDIGMHESTVSRVTTEKYVHTPRGVFELKFFFSWGLKTAGGADISSSSVKERIKALIADENPLDPISDQRIVTVLQGEKIDIARRTVAKYRETLGIPPSSQRKRLL